MRINLFVAGLIAVIVLPACSNQAQKVYEEKSYGLPLEVPPDLTKPEARRDELSIFTDREESAQKTGRQENCNCDASQSVMPALPQQDGISLQRDGAQRWMVLQGDPRQIWPWVREFWLQNGFRISLEDPVIGLVETDWKQQRNNLPLKPAEQEKGAEVAVGQDEFEAKILAVPQMEKYRVRLEGGEQPGTTDLFLTHRGVELVARDKMIVWELRKSDPELEAEMMQRMLVHFKLEQQEIGAALASRNQVLNIATLIKNENDRATLKVDIEFVRLWRRIGLVLDRMDYIIENSDRAVGTYFLRAKSPLRDEDVKEEKSWFASLFSDDSEEQARRIQVVLRDEGESTHININDSEGVLLKDEQAEKILAGIMNHLQ